MVAVCSVPGCGNETGCKENIRMHGFPLANEYLLQNWLKVICRKNWYPTKHSKICGDHFIQNDYISLVSHRLKPDAIPSCLLPVAVKCVDCLPENDILKRQATSERPPLQELQIVSDEPIETFELVKIEDVDNEEIEEQEIVCDPMEGIEQGKVENVSNQGIMKVVKKHEGTQTTPLQRNCLTQNEILLKKEIKTLEKNLQRKNKKISELTALLKEFRNSKAKSESSPQFIVVVSPRKVTSSEQVISSTHKKRKK